MAVTFRKLTKSDLLNGFPQLLSMLSPVGDVSNAELLDKFEKRENLKCYNTFVGEIGGKLACTATLLVEEKFIHNCSKAGHIEDVVVDPEYRGTGIGKQLIGHLVEQAKKCDCYKIILECDDDKMDFYKLSNFQKHANVMSLYFNK